jgi:hypothetical protein
VEITLHLKYSPFIQWRHSQTFRNWYRQARYENLGAALK